MNWQSKLAIALTFRAIVLRQSAYMSKYRGLFVWFINRRLQLWYWLKHANVLSLELNTSLDTVYSTGTDSIRVLHFLTLTRL